MTKREKQAAAALGLLALIGAAYALTGKRDDDEDDDDTLTPVPAKPGGRPTPPKGPGGFVPDDRTCSEGQVWNEALQACMTPIVVQPAEPGEDPTVVVNRYLRPGDRTGSLYAIKFGDNPVDVAKKAIRGEFGDVNESGLYTPQYVGLMAVHSWNLALYSAIWEPLDPASPPYPSQKGKSKRTKPSYRRYTAEEYDPDAQLRSWTVKDAFLKVHKDNLTRLRAGKDPERATDEWGVQIEGGNWYGLIWLPKILTIAQGGITVEQDVPPDLAALAPNIYG